MLIYDPNERSNWGQREDGSLDNNFTTSDKIVESALARGIKPENIIGATNLKDAAAEMSRLGLEGKVSRIYIWDHSNANGQYLGESVIPVGSFRRLKPFVGPSSDVSFIGCNVGRNYSYMESVSKQLRLNKTTGLQVYGYSGFVETRSVNGVCEPLPDPETGGYRGAKWSK